jgi:hypothetical protein
MRKRYATGDVHEFYQRIVCSRVAVANRCRASTGSYLTDRKDESRRGEPRAAHRILLLLRCQRLHCAAQRSRSDGDNQSDSNIHCQIPMAARPLAETPLTCVSVAA